MEVRLGTVNDVPALRALDAESAAVDSIDGNSMLVLRETEMLDFFIDRQGLIVAMEDSHILGYILTHLVDWMHGCRRMVWIEHIGVHPHARRQGVGLTLLRFVEEHYRGKAVCIHGSIHPKNARSLRLFGKLGAEMDDRVLFYRPL